MIPEEILTNEGAGFPSVEAMKEIERICVEALSPEPIVLSGRQYVFYNGKYEEIDQKFHERADTLIDVLSQDGFIELANKWKTGNSFIKLDCNRGVFVQDRNTRLGAETKMARYGYEFADLPGDRYMGLYDFIDWLDTVAIEIEGGIIQMDKDHNPAFGLSHKNEQMRDAFRTIKYFKTNSVKVEETSGFINVAQETSEGGQTGLEKLPNFVRAWLQFGNKGPAFPFVFKLSLRQEGGLEIRLKEVKRLCSRDEFISSFVTRLKKEVKDVPVFS